MTSNNNEHHGSGASQGVGTSGFSRRAFLEGTGVLVVSFTIADALGPLEPTGEAFAQVVATAVDSFVAISRDGGVTGFTGKVDLGTGISVGLRQMLADELDVAYERVSWIQGDTSITPSQGATVGSNTIRNAGPTIRRAAAAARQFLLVRASERLGVPLDQLVVNEGVVSVRSDPSKNVSYGDLIGGQRFDIDVPAADKIQLKTPDQFKIIGKSIPRGDVDKRISGAAFVNNVKVPGMVHGRSVLPPHGNARLLSVDESSVGGMPGLIKVVVEGNYVGVVAEREEQAINIAKALRVTWSDAEPSLPVQEDLYVLIKSLQGRASFIGGNPLGDVDAVLSTADKVYTATYLWPFQMHGSIAPPCGVADVSNGGATIWSGTQNPFGERTVAGNYLQIPAAEIPGRVRVIYVEAAGVYGRSGFYDDASLEAVILSKAVGRPVRVQWMREDEHQYEPKGPPHVVTVRGALDAQGRVLAYDYEDRFFPWRHQEPLAARLTKPATETTAFGDGTGCAGQDYVFPNRRIVALNIPWQGMQATGLRTNNNRAPGDPARDLASEGFLDELAAAAKADPVAFRLLHLTDQRAIDVIKAAAERYGWQARPSPIPGAGGTGVAIGRGIAFALRRTYVAAVAEVEVDQSSGHVRVKRVVIAHDCGLMINPDSVTQQVEGNVIQTIGRALKEEVQFDTTKVTSLDWVGYEILTYPEVPAVDVVLINRPTVESSGVGEPALNPIPAAIGNAIFDATGARLRQVPFTPERVKEALDKR
ncbi:MAG: xanthine dehydrogenase family protein molybdopterin-binding subunit [Acidobacteria bacterium]|nr:xanthine dehydrogenase family protein molybdopterin-binding subunit [Acidobacteriota bacterium]